MGTSFWFWGTQLVFILCAVRGVQGLQCYECEHTSDTADEACVSNGTHAKITPCAPGEAYCKTEHKRMEMTQVVFEMTSRSCAAECSSTRKNVDDNTHQVMCCQHDLCNSAHLAPASEAAVAGVALIATLHLIRYIQPGP